MIFFQSIYFTSFTFQCLISTIHLMIFNFINVYKIMTSIVKEIHLKDNYKYYQLKLIDNLRHLLYLKNINIRTLLCFFVLSFKVLITYNNIHSLYNKDRLEVTKSLCLIKHKVKNLFSEFQLEKYLIQNPFYKFINNLSKYNFNPTN